MNGRLLAQVLAMVLFATALRRQTDLGDVLSPAWFWGLLGLGVVLLLAGAPRLVAAGGEGEVRRSHWPLLLGSLWLLAVPTEPAVALAIVGAAVLVSSRLPARLSRPNGSMWFLLFALLAATAVAAVVDSLALLRPSWPAVASVLTMVMRGLGLAASSAGDLVFVSGPKMEQGFRAAPASLGLAAHVGITIVLWFSRSWSVDARHSLRAWAPLAYLPVALVLRFLWLVGLAIAMDHGARHDDLDFDLGVFLDWRLGLLLDVLAGVPAAMLLSRPSPPATERPAAPQSASVAPAPRLWLAFVAPLLGLSWSSDRLLDCVGATKPGRIAIDELHSRWESSDVRLTRDHYGQESGYNFRGLADWLEGGYGKVRRLYDPLAAGSLRDVDVLIVKTPTEPFQPEELAVIHEFVAQGGGLVLIGDHTNVFGTSENLNRIAEPYGIRFVYDCCFDHRNRFEFCYRREAHVGNHPIVRGVDTLFFEVGCTLDLDSPRVRPIVVGRSLKSQAIDYGVENFYGAPRDTSEQECGQFALLATCASGEGRVVAIADSTLFSTFSVFMPGRREIVEGMVAYANGRDVGEGLRELLWRLSLGLTLVVLLLVAPRLDLRTFVTGAVLAIGSGNLAVAVAEALLYPGQPDLRAAHAAREVKFVWEDGPVVWPVHGFSTRPDVTFDMLFQYATRSGGLPRLVRSLPDATASRGPIVWIDPVPDDPAAAAQQLLAFAASGGRVVLLETSARPLVTELAARLGLQVRDATAAATGVRTAAGAIPVPAGAAWFRRLTGGATLIEAEGGPDAGAVGVVQGHGRGQIAILTCGSMFANTNFGLRYGTVPEPEMRRLYEVYYAIIAAALGS